MLFHNVKLLVAGVDEFDLIDVEVGRVRVAQQFQEDGDVVGVSTAARVHHHPPLALLVEDCSTVKYLALLLALAVVVNYHLVSLEGRDCLFDD